MSVWSRMFYSHYIRYSLLDLIPPPIFLNTTVYAFTFTFLTTLASFTKPCFVPHFLDMERASSSVLILCYFFLMVILYSLCVWISKLYLQSLSSLNFLDVISALGFFTSWNMSFSRNFAEFLLLQKKNLYAVFYDIFVICYNYLFSRPWMRKGCISGQWCVILDLATGCTYMHKKGKIHLLKLFLILRKKSKTRWYSRNYNAFLKECI